MAGVVDFLFVGRGGIGRSDSACVGGSGFVGRSAGFIRGPGPQKPLSGPKQRQGCKKIISTNRQVAENTGSLGLGTAFTKTPKDQQSAE
jgi:hypothetical protein